MSISDRLSEIYEEDVKIWGPYRCSDGRMRVDVKTRDRPKGYTQQYARVLLEIKLGRRLLPGETVDHIDEDKTNDDPSNLQVLSRSSNSRKSADATSVINWNRSRAGSPELSIAVSGENNGLAKLTNLEVQRIRETFVQSGDLRELAKKVPVSRKSLRNLLSGLSYKNAGGPLVKFIKGSHGRFVIRNEG